MNAGIQRSRYTLGLAVGLGSSIGWLDLHTTEVAVTILALLSSGVLLGWLQPIAAWRWAVVLALGLPIAAGAGHLLGIRTAEPIRLDPRVALAGFAFALAGLLHRGGDQADCASDALVTAGAKVGHAPDPRARCQPTCSPH